MTKFTFDNYKRKDDELATNGAWFHEYDEEGRSWGKFKVKFFDLESDRGEKIYNRAQKKWDGVAKRDGLTDFQKSVSLFVDTYMVDWDIPEDLTGGEKLPFSVADAIAFLSHEETKWLGDSLYFKSRKITNFNVVTDKDGESVVPEKNS